MVSVYAKEMRTVLSSDLSGLFTAVTKLCDMVYTFSTKNNKLETVNSSNFQL